MKKTNKELAEDYLINGRVDTGNGSFIPVSSIIKNERDGRLIYGAFLACAEIKDKEIEELKKFIGSDHELKLDCIMEKYEIALKLQLDETVKLLREAVEKMKLINSIGYCLEYTPSGEYAGDSICLEFLNENQQQLTKILGGEG